MDTQCLICLSLCTECSSCCSANFHAECLEKWHAVSKRDICPHCSKPLPKQYVEWLNAKLVVYDSLVLAAVYFTYLVYPTCPFPLLLLYLNTAMNKEIRIADYLTDKYFESGERQACELENAIIKTYGQIFSMVFLILCFAPHYHVFQATGIVALTARFLVNGHASKRWTSNFVADSAFGASTGLNNLLS
jgi:hypothetical protein